VTTPPAKRTRSRTRSRTPTRTRHVAAAPQLDYLSPVREAAVENEATSSPLSPPPETPARPRADSYQEYINFDMDI
jgi:hypothetical protein